MSNTANTAEFSARRFKPAAATLLVAYLLVLQGFTAGFAANGRTAFGGLFGNSICLSKPDALNGGNPALPARSGQKHDGCCAFHSSGMGGPVSWFSDAIDRTLVVSGATTADTSVGRVGFLATLPVGSRAPPTLYL